MLGLSFEFLWELWTGHAKVVFQKEILTLFHVKGQG